MVTFVTCEDFVLQGDVFRSLDLPSPRLEDWQQETLASPAVVVASSCDVSKPADLVTVARIFPITLLDKGKAGTVKKGRTAGHWYLEELPNLGDAYVDFATMTPVVSSWLHTTRDISLGKKEPRARATAETPERLGRMAEPGLGDMMEKLATFLLRPLPVNKPWSTRLRRALDVFRT